MVEPLSRALTRVRASLLERDGLVRAVATGGRRGAQPRWRRVELRYVDIKAGRHLQVTRYDDTQAHTSNHAAGQQAEAAVDDLLDEPFGSWYVAMSDRTLQVRVTKNHDATVHLKDADRRSSDAPPLRAHDRVKDRVLAPDDPVLVALGISDGDGRVKPSRQAKYRQVEEFLRALGAALDETVLRDVTSQDPLRVADLGCGNAYLTFAAHRYLTKVRGLPVRLIGVDVKAQSVAHSSALAASLGTSAEMTFIQAPISAAAVDQRPDVVLALHACDTATDDALAAAVGWQSPLLLAAPCCHHDLASQLRRSTPPAPYTALTQDGILRERFADTLTDAIRALILRQLGYHVDVVEFVESRHTPRNTLLRARRTGSAPDKDAARELRQLTQAWGLRPRLAELLHAELARG